MKNIAVLNLSSCAASARSACSPSRGQSRLLRGTAAALTGLIAVVAGSVATDAVLHATGIFPEHGRMASGLYVLAATYRTLYGIAGSYLAARLAPNRPMAYAVGLGCFGLVTSLVGALATWGNGPEFGPHWYPLALVATAIPAAWLGGRLHGLGSRGTR